jgi:hypothetical protein
VHCRIFLHICLSEHLKYYKRAGEYFDPQLVIIDVPYDGQVLQGYLHRPPVAVIASDYASVTAIKNNR